MSQNRKGECGAPALHTQYQLVGPFRDPPQKIPTRTPASVRKPSNTLKNKPQFSAGANSHQREPRACYHEPPNPGPHLQPLSVPGRVTSSSNTESITDTEEVVALVWMVEAPLDPPRGRDPPDSPGPRPLQCSPCSNSGGAAGIQTAAAAIFPGASSYGNEAESTRCLL